jgi:hypothetical protein
LIVGSIATEAEAEAERHFARRRRGETALASVYAAASRLGEYRCGGGFPHEHMHDSLYE